MDFENIKRPKRRSRSNSLTMGPDKSATEANNTQVSDSELVDEKIYPLYLSQKAENAVLEYEQIDWETKQNQGQPERWHAFKSP